MGKKIIVIGGGISGLCSAALLAKDGFDVTLIEKNAQLGGRMGQWKHKGFVFDTGPSWYLMPEVMEQFFGRFGKSSKDYYKLLKLAPSYRAYFENEYVDVFSDLNKSKKLFDTFEDSGGSKLEKYLKHSEKLYIASMPYLYKNNYDLMNLINLDTIKLAASFPFWQNMEQYIGKYFSSTKAKKLLMYNLVFLGGAPKSTPALYSLMAHVDFNLGVYYPMGGMYELVRALTSLCQENKVKIIKNCTVQKIDSVGNKIKLVKTNKGSFKADVFVNTSDYWHFESKVLGNSQRSYSRNYWDKRKVAPSAFVVLIGVRKKIKSLKHHNMFFAKDWDKHFDEVFENLKWPKDPSFYVCAPSATDPSVAPIGMENLFVLVPIAAGLKDSLTLRNRYTRFIINKIEEYTGEHFAQDIIFKKVFSISDFKSEFNAFRGSAFGLSHTLFQTSFLRPNIKSKKLDNLYHAGQYVHPGIGVPSVMISAEIAAREIGKKYK